MAAYNGKDRVVEVLLGAGADPTWTVTKKWNGINAGSTPLQIATRQGYSVIATMIRFSDI